MNLTNRIKSIAFLIISVFLTGCDNTIDTADELIDAHIEALGGYQAVKSIHTLTFIATYEEATFKQVHRFDRKRPNFIRVTTNYDEETGSFGYCEGFDGAAWEYSAKVPVRVVGEPARALKNASEFEKPYIDYQDKGYTAKFMGITSIKDNEVYHLQLSKIDGTTKDYFFDVNSLMESVSIGNAPFHGEGATIEIFEKRSDYRPVNGVLMSFKNEQRSGEKVLSTWNCHSIEANKDVPDEWFSPPLSQEEAVFKAFREDFLAGKLDQITSEYSAYRMLAEGQLRKKLENQINTYGYELISYERYEDAIRIFKLGIENYPESSNLYDSLGETYLTIGDTLQAIENYQKSVDLNPGNVHGKEVLSSIKSTE